MYTPSLLRFQDEQMSRAARFKSAERKHLTTILPQPMEHTEGARLWGPAHEETQAAELEGGASACRHQGRITAPKVRRHVSRGQPAHEATDVAKFERAASAGPHQRRITAAGRGCPVKPRAPSVGLHEQTVMKAKNPERNPQLCPVKEAMAARMASVT